MRWILSLVIVLAISLGSATTTPAQSQSAAMERRLAVEQDVLWELNRVRQARGLTRLRWESGLRSAAARHSRSMLALGFFAHESADGTPFHNRIRRHYPPSGFGTWSVAETLLSGPTSIDARRIVAAWLASPGHRAVVLQPAWRDAGIGAYFRRDAPGHFGGVETLVVTADFGHRSGG